MMDPFPVAAEFRLFGPGSARSSLISHPPWELSRYETERSAYYEDLQRYLSLLDEWDNFRARSFVIDSIILNTGLVPGQHAAARLLFPLGLEVRTQDQLPNPPMEPDSPQPPSLVPVRSRRTFTARFGLSEREQLERVMLSSTAGFLTARIMDMANGTFVEEQFANVQQQTQVEIDSLTVTFPSLEEVRNFTIKAEARADWMAPWSGDLHVIVE